MACHSTKAESPDKAGQVFEIFLEKEGRRKAFEGYCIPGRFEWTTRK
jgi:hypothetical protein